MRALSALIVVAAAFGLAGCASEDARQTDARHAVEARIASLADYTGQVRCTRNPKPWFVEKQATVFFCAARRAGGGGGCDLFRATLANAGWVVVLATPNAGCVLPQ